MTDTLADGTDDLDGLDELRAVAREVARDPQTGWKQWAELGWLSLLVSEERGGAGADERAAALVARELGAAGRQEPFATAGILTSTLLAGVARTAEVDGLLGSVLAGEVLAAAAWQPRSGALPAGADGCSGTARYSQLLPVAMIPGGAGGAVDGVGGAVGGVVGGAVELVGTACWLPTADADVWLVAARTPDDGVALVRLDADAEGLTVHPSRAADGSTQAHLELDRALGRVLAPEAGAALARAVDIAALITAAELLGGIDTMVTLTCTYLAERKQFGRPIGTFQVLQHRAVDMWVQQQLAEAALDAALRRVTAAGPATAAGALPAAGPATAAGALEQDPGIRAIAASSAKSRASSAALKVASEAVQLHGAIGFTEEYELGRYVNRAFVLAASLGNARAHVRRHGRLVSA